PEMCADLDIARQRAFIATVDPSMTNQGTTTDARTELESIIEHVGHLLPAQGPISVFVHHNPLHAFEHLPFTEAVERAALLFGCEPYLREARYRAALARGRIAPGDVRAVLDELRAQHGAAGRTPEPHTRFVRHRDLL